MNFENSTDLREVLMGMDNQCQANTPKHEWLNEKDVAILIGVSVYTLRQHRHKGIGLPYVKYGKSVRYSIADIFEYLKSRTINHNKV
jgi:hypothetical protein